MNQNDMGEEGLKTIQAQSETVVKLRYAALFAIMLLIISSGCISTPPEATPTPAPTSTPMPTATPAPTPTPLNLEGAVRDVVSSENPDRADELLDLGPEAVPIYLELLRENSTFGRWCALYALSNVAYDLNASERREITDELTPLFTQDPTSIRMMAGAVATELGDKRGIPVLIGCLNETARFRDSEPPAPICYYANDFLVRFTDVDFNYSCNYGGYDADAAAEWQAWWAASGAQLQWNENVKKFGVPNE